MNKFYWTKALGYGLLIWAIMTFALWILGSITALSPLWAHSLVAIIGGISAFLLAGNVRAEDGSMSAGYGLVWAAMVVILDFAITQWLDPHIFAVWQYWLSPALVFLAPWLQAGTRTQPAQPV